MTFLAVAETFLKARLTFLRALRAFLSAGLAFLFALPACATLTPAQEQAADFAVSASVECVVQPAVQCMWGAGATGYKVCLRNHALECLQARAASAVSVAVGLFNDLYGVKLAGLVQPSLEAAATAKLCIDAIDAELVADQCPDGKAPRKCVVDAVAWCVDHGDEAGLRE